MAGHHQQIQRTPCRGSVERTGSFGKTRFADLYVYVLLQADCSKQRRIQCVMHRFRELHGSIRAELVICCHLSPLHWNVHDFIGKNHKHFFIWQPSQIWWSVQESHWGWAHPGSRPTTQRGISWGLTVSLARFRRRHPGNISKVYDVNILEIPT